MILALLLSWTPRFGFGQAPSLNYSGPLVITSGGTYSGNFRSTDSNTPVIRISTTQPVIIENATLVGPGTIIDAYNVRANLIVRGTKGYGTTPTVNGRAPGRFIEASNPIQLKVENNYLEQTAGMYIYQWGGSGAADQTLTVRYNQAKNIDGRKRGGGDNLVQFLQLNQVRNLANVEIAWNQVINEPNNSRVEDNINFSNSGGTAQSPNRVHDNYVQGAYPYPANAPGYSGTGMTTDGDGSTPATTAAFINAYNNQFVSTCNAAMNIASGHDIRYYNNRMVTSSYLPDGTKLNATYAATSIFNAYQVPSSVMYNNSVDNNVIGFAKDGFSMPFPGRHDLSSGACSPCTNTTHLPNPITVATEQNEFSLWQQKLRQNGISVGPAGMSSNPTTPTSPTPAPAPTPSPAPAPAPAPAPTAPSTGSTPMSGPANATFFRGINVNGGAVTLDGNNWVAASGNLQVSGASPFTASVGLNPATDASRTGMIRSAVWGTSVNATVPNVANGSYSVYLYFFEDNSVETFNIGVEGQTVRSGYNSGAAGHWDRLGPFTANVADGNLSITTSGGAANLSGIEIWKNNTTTPTPAPAPAPTPTPTPTPTNPSTSRTLFRAVNINGSAQTIDGITYEDGTTFRNISTNGGKFANQNVALTPATDAARAQMIRSSVWGSNLNVTVSSVPSGTYEVAYYIWEDNSPETYSATVNGQTLLTSYNSGAAGTWRKTAPVRVTVTNGQITLQSSGNGHMNVSGLEIFRVQ
ncbi:hypothetical protein [Hymenobacter sp. CRA2]|uniref:hypothetical protein n=1 Tax=Hymenobacter sp. CRA2 TaxID=1955620 RepID=UPI00098FFB20|nr:hypothetical protein [Hymenobacter sp. CRA2]OON65692.1 hypothetical protein B0919_23750 [Hymenobacter sp. CRA2]